MKQEGCDEDGVQNEKTLFHDFSNDVLGQASTKLIDY
jgi:hypothetical protein